MRFKYQCEYKRWDEYFKKEFKIGSWFYLDKSWRFIKFKPSDTTNMTIIKLKLGISMLQDFPNINIKYKCVRIVTELKNHDIKYDHYYPK